MKSTGSQAVQTAMQMYRVNRSTGTLRNKENQTVGSNTYEPRVSVRFKTRSRRIKYNVRISRICGFLKFGPVALEKGVQIRHFDGDKSNNSGSNLRMNRQPIVRGNLSTAQIRRIRNLTTKGRFSTGEIAQRTGASRHQVRRIATGQAHIAVV